MYIAITYIAFMHKNKKNITPDMPQERILLDGPKNLLDSELLSLILRSGGKDMPVLNLAKEILVKCDGLYGLSQITPAKLKELRYIGNAKAACLLSLVELAIRITSPNDSEPIVVLSPETVFNILRKDFFAKKRECLYLLSLDGKNRLIAKDMISLGTINSTLVSPREIFRQALLRNATAIILSHNHPSHNLNPSSEDLFLTDQVAKLGQTMEIPLIDHVIITDTSYTSLKAANLFEAGQKGGEN